MIATEPVAEAGPRIQTDLPDAVRDSFACCHRITRSRARNFYYGLKLTPEPRRSAVYAIYAFMRCCDDMADEVADNGNGRDAAARIEAFRASMQRVLDGGPLPPGPIWPAFRHVTDHYPVDGEHLHAMLDGQLADLTTSRYESFDRLHDYCYKVASVVGLTCISIWGCDEDPRTRKLAENRGVALQLTNILRDLAEDAARGRIYLPQDEMERFGCAESDLLAGRAGGGFDRLLAFQVERARDYYARSADLESRIDPSCRPTCWALMRIYRGLLERIAADPRRVLTDRVRLGSFEKAAIGLRATWKRTWGGGGDGRTMGR